MGILTKMFGKKNHTKSIVDYEREYEKNNKTVVTSIDELIRVDEQPMSDESGKIQYGEEKEYILPNVDMIGDDSKELIPFIERIKEQKDITIPIGKNNDEILVEKMSNMPNLLIGGTVMSGKSTYINSILISMLLTQKPSDLKMIIFDSKKVEYSQYNDIPHLMTPIINDERKLSIVLKKIGVEIQRRYELLSDSNTKNVTGYNSYINKLNETRSKSDQLKYLPSIVIILDDYSNLNKTDIINENIEYISKNGWNANVYLIVVANHPSNEIISTISKSNFPARISFRVTSKRDSMIILDQEGAEKLTKIGNALYKSRFSIKPINVIIPFISDNDISNVVDFCIQQQKAYYDSTLTMNDEEMKSTSMIDIPSNSDSDEEPLYNEIVEFVVTQGKASASLLQRRFRLGYNRAARCIDLLEERGIIGPQIGSKPREILIKLEK